MPVSGSQGDRRAEDYLEARYRLYWAVYMHKTTRAAEKMLEELLRDAASSLRNDSLARREPVLRYLTAATPSLDAYLRLDDAAVWAALAEYAECSQPRVAELARRLRDRNLYKCLDVGSRGEPQGNLYLRFRHELNEHSIEWAGDLLFDDESTVTPYTWYDFNDASALNKVLVKDRADLREPKDIADESKIVKALDDNGRPGRIQRVYAPDKEKIEDLGKILQEVRTS